MERNPTSDSGKAHPDLNPDREATRENHDQVGRTEYSSKETLNGREGFSGGENLSVRDDFSSRENVVEERLQHPIGQNEPAPDSGESGEALTTKPGSAGAYSLWPRFRQLKADVSPSPPEPLQPGGMLE